MHTNVLIHEKIFLETYFAQRTNLDIVEIGSLNVNGSLKETALPYAKTYTGVDFASGKDVDVVLNDPYYFPFKDNTFDLLLTSSCFEHSEFFWITFLESLRILKPEGILWYTVPGAWMSYHQYPVDCWRFYPDSSIALEKWARRNAFNCKMLESYMATPSCAGECSDAVAVFVKDEINEKLYPNKIHYNHSDKLINGHLDSGNTFPIRPYPLDYRYPYKV